MEIPLSLLLSLGARRVRPVALLVESPLSLDEARRALMVATQDGPPAIDFGQFALYGAVEDDEFDLRWDQGDHPPGIVRGKLRADGQQVRVHVLVSEGPTPIVLWLLVIAFPFLILWATSKHLLPDLGPAGDIARSVVAGGLYGITAFLILRRPAGPSRRLVAQAKGFLSRALLAEAIEVDPRARD